jgi:hypothetical protein
MEITHDILADQRYIPEELKFALINIVREKSQMFSSEEAARIENAFRKAMTVPTELSPRLQICIKAQSKSS